MITLYSDQMLLGAGTSIPTTQDPYLYVRVKEAYTISIDRGSRSPDFNDVMEELVSLFTMDSFYETRSEVARNMGLPIDHPEVRALAMEASTMASKNFCEAVEPTIEDILEYERLCFMKRGRFTNDPQSSIFDLMKGGVTDEDNG